MNNKYVSPYFDNIRLIVGTDYFFENHIYQSYYGVFTALDDIWYHTRSDNSYVSGSFATRKEAETDLDKFLIEKGYTLLTQEQYDKLKLLF